ncbi:Ig-like domain-containing protein [Clostridium sp. YIM B02555]|uniref:Ig-like domain-containing protein n=1 Tax=Clostridium sp. YIM B02555 TaxID=2911968 RepID=UPI001EEEB4C9|nr:Ig-like domain-containing protein [Clostridium sp. YIM B02555]
MRNYFKKLSIMFVMALAIIGIGMIQNGSVANADTLAQYQRGTKYFNQPLQGYNRYDDKDESILYSDNFVDYSSTTQKLSNLLYGGNRKELHSGSGGGTIKFSFYGTSIALIDYICNDRTKDCTISFDRGETSETFSAYGSATSNQVSPTGNQTAFYVKNGLENKRHDVIINIPASNDSWFCLDAIDTDGHLVSYGESISLDKSTMSLIEGDSDKLTAITTPSAVGVTWTSSDPSIATIEVDPTNGKITKINAIKEGTCTITATTTDGSNLSASCTINVTKKTEPIPTPDPQPTDTDYITNIAHAKGTNTNNPGGDVTIIFHGSSDTTLSLVKTADVKDVWIGDNFTYTLVITNTGIKTAKAVVVSDPAPNHIDFNVSGVTTTQGTVDSSSTSKNIIVNVGDILPGGTVTIKIPSTVIA